METNSLRASLGAINKPRALFAVIASLTLASLPGFCASAAPPVTSATPRPALLAEIPFVLRDNHVILDIQVGKDYDSASHSPVLHFVLDSGASTSALSTEALRTKGLSFEVSPMKDKATVQGTGDSEGVKADRWVKMAMRIGSFRFHDSLLVVPFSKAFQSTNIDGLLGSDFLHAYVTEIDFENHLVRLYDRSDFQPPASSEHFTAIPISFPKDGGSALIHCDVAFGQFPPARAALEIDTGADDCAELSGSFVSRQHWEIGPKNSVRRVSGGFDGESKERVSRLKNLQIGSVRLDGPPLAVSSNKHGADIDPDYDGRLGNEIFKRFTVILDYEDDILYLRPNAASKSPFKPVKSFGFAIVPPKPSDAGFTVARVEDEAPAAHAGMLVGDVIVEVGGKRTAHMSGDELFNRLRAIHGATKFVILRGATMERHTIKITPITF